MMVNLVVEFNMSVELLTWHIIHFVFKWAILMTDARYIMYNASLRMTARHLSNLIESLDMYTNLQN